MDVTGLWGLKYIYIYIQNDLLGDRVDSLKARRSNVRFTFSGFKCEATAGTWIRPRSKLLGSRFPNFE